MFHLKHAYSHSQVPETIPHFELSPVQLRGQPGQISWINAARISQIKIPFPGSSQVQGPDPASGDKVQSGTRVPPAGREDARALLGCRLLQQTEPLCLCLCWAPWTAVPWSLLSAR